MKDHLSDIGSVLIALVVGAASAVGWVSSNFASFREFQSLESRLIRIEQKLDSFKVKE